MTHDMSGTCLSWTAGTFILLAVTSSVAGELLFQDFKTIFVFVKICNL